MFECALCRWGVELDDVVLRFTDGRVICLVCYEREVKGTKYLAARVRRDARDAAEGAQ